MSHDATNWAIKQRGIKPAMKIVLWHLCDRYNPDFGCFPKQETLADDCELSRSTLNVYLDELEKLRLIYRERRFKPGTKKQDSTRYRFPFEADFPCPESGHGSENSVSENEDVPSPENGDSRVRNLDTNPVREPVREPVTERERARDDLEGKAPESTEPAETPKQIEAEFIRLVSNWKESKHRGLDLARKRWQALTPDDRRQALEKYPAWREAIGGDKIKNPPQYSTYIGEKLWQTIPEPPPAPKLTHDLAGPWGKLWMGTFLADTSRKAYGPLTALTAMQRHQIESGYLRLDDVMREKRRQLGWPKANRMLELAEVRKGCVCALELVEPSATFQAVKRDSDVYAAWVGEFQRRGIPWASGKPAEWLYFPPLPDGLPLAEAVSAALDAYVTTISEIIQRSETDAAA